MATNRSVMDQSPKPTGGENVLAGAISSLVDLGLGWPDLMLFFKGIAQGKTVSEALQTPGLSRHAKDKLEELTNLPVSGATPGQEGSYAFGQGALPFPLFQAKTGLGVAVSMLSGAAVGGSLSTAGTILFPDNPTAQLMLGLLPAGANAAHGVARELIAAKYRGKLDPALVKNFEKGKLTLGELTGDRNILAQEEFFRSNPKTANMASSYERTRIADLENQLGKLVTKPVSINTTGVAVRAFKAFENHAEAIKKVHKDLTDAEFKAALQAIPSHKRIFDTSLINVAIDDILNQYKGLANTYDTEQIVSQLRRIKAQLVNADGSPKNMTGPEFQAQLRQWGEKAATGEGLFKDVGISTSKGIASKIFGSFTDTLEQTANNLDIITYAPEVADVAAKLKAARANFKARTEALEIEQKKPINQFFKDRGVADALGDPEKVRNALLNSTGTDRQYLFKILEQNDPELATKIRGDLFDRMVQKGYVKGKSDIEPQFSPEQFLKAFDESSFKDATFLADTIPDPKQRALFLQRVGEMRKMASTGIIIPDNGPKELSGALATATGMRAVESSFLTNSLSHLRNFVVGKEQMFDYLFNPELPGKNGVEKFQNAMLKTAKGTLGNQNLFSISAGLIGTYKAMEAARESGMPAEAPKTAQEPPKSEEGISIPPEVLDALKGSKEEVVIPDDVLSALKEKPAGADGMVSHEDFPKVSPEEQAQRDAVSRQLIEQEATPSGERYTQQQKDTLKRMRIQNIQQEMQLQRRNPMAIQALTQELQREMARP